MTQAELEAQLTQLTKRVDALEKKLAHYEAFVTGLGHNKTITGALTMLGIKADLTSIGNPP